MQCNFLFLVAVALLGPMGFLSILNAADDEQPLPLPKHPQRHSAAIDSINSPSPENSKPQPARNDRETHAKSASRSSIKSNRSYVPGKPSARRGFSPVNAHGLDAAPSSSEAESPGDDVSCGSTDEIAAAEESPLGLVEILPHSIHDGGITGEYIYTGETFTLANGGLANRSATNYRGNLDLLINVDTQRLGAWKGGRFFVYGNHVHGRPLSKDFVGDAQLFSNIDSTISPTGRPYYMQVSEYFYEHQTDWLRVKIGKSDANADFALSDLGAEFVHSSFQLPPSIPLPTFPSQALGMSSFVTFAEKYTLGGAIYDGTPPYGPQGGQFGFATLGHNGVTSLLQLERRDQFGPGNELPNTLRVGAWHNSANDVWTALDPTVSRTFGQNFGYWATMDQLLWKEQSDGEDDQGLSAFFLFSWCPQDRNPITQSYAGGILYKGLLPGRDQDFAGFGAANVHFGEPVRNSTFAETGESMRSAETACEFFYKLTVSPFVYIQPEIQYIFDPGGLYRDALLPGMRFQAAF